jgi:DNA modification methylase
VIQLHCGNSLDVLATLGSNSVDSIVTDPPYGLSFMGKGWDYQVPSVQIWEQCLRVLKPGGHLLAFAGTRTQHRMCVNIEDAGFEIRDMIAWVYGSGFPKSMNVGKAIDKVAPRRGQFDAFAEHFDAMWQISGLKRSEFVPHFPHYKNPASIMAQLSNWKLAKNVPSKRDFLVLQNLLHLSDGFSELIDRVEAEREVIGKKTWSASASHFVPGEDHSQRVNLDITAPATPEAQQWDGWGTALKPALEPITVARKPFKGTVANNVLEHGTGAINIDGCRVGTEQIEQGRFGRGVADSTSYHDGLKPTERTTATGRWPANLIHDGSDEVTELFPQTVSGKPPGVRGASKHNVAYADVAIGSELTGYGDSGSAARFFYCPKANKKDREDGNTHPTVKPTDLMAYLCRLVTPPSGIILDPFMGSGSTGKAAVREGFSFIGIDKEEEYVAIASKRLQVIQRSILASRSADQNGWHLNHSRHG